VGSNLIEKDALSKLSHSVMPIMRTDAPIIAQAQFLRITPNAEDFAPDGMQAAYQRADDEDRLRRVAPLPWRHGRGLLALVELE
jgi:hypothetical protein